MIMNERYTDSVWCINTLQKVEETQLDRGKDGHEDGTSHGLFRLLKMNFRSRCPSVHPVRYVKGRGASSCIIWRSSASLFLDAGFSNKTCISLFSSFRTSIIKEYNNLKLVLCLALLRSHNPLQHGTKFTSSVLQRSLGREMRQYTTCGQSPSVQCRLRAMAMFHRNVHLHQMTAGYCLPAWAAFVLQNHHPAGTTAIVRDSSTSG